MARRSVQWRHEFSFPGDPPPPMARMAGAADDRRALPPPWRPAENRLAPRAGEEDFRWLQASRPGSPESGSGTPSPQLWAQQHPHYDRLYPASAGSSPSRAQAIAGYRREMLDLVRGLPEAAYELSLRDIVESRGPGPSPLPPPPPPLTQHYATTTVQQQEVHEPKKHVATAAMPMGDEQARKQSGGKKQRKQRTMGRTRSRSVERSVSLDTGLLIKLFMPLSVGRKQKVSPKPAAAKEGKKKTKKVKLGKKKEEEEEWWKKSEFSEAGSSSRTSSTGSSNSSASRNGNGHVGGGSNPQAPARSRSRKKIGCYGFFRHNKGTNGVIEE